MMATATKKPENEMKQPADSYPWLSGELKPEHMGELMKLLRDYDFQGRFGESVIQRTEGVKTGRGYDTTGYDAQAIVCALNEVIGINHWKDEHEVTISDAGKTSKGHPRYQGDARLRLVLGNYTDTGEFVPVAERVCYGGHITSFVFDSRKAAYTNALKKCAALFGLGWRAYMGVVDEDNTPIPEGAESVRKAPPVPTSKQTTTASTRDKAEPPPEESAESLAELRKGIYTLAYELARVTTEDYEGMEEAEKKTRAGACLIEAKVGAAGEQYRNKKLSEIKTSAILKVIGEELARRVRDATPSAEPEGGELEENF